MAAQLTAMAEAKGALRVSEYGKDQAHEATR
jgi:hypothetical protein